MDDAPRGGLHPVFHVEHAPHAGADPRPPADVPIRCRRRAVVGLVKEARQFSLKNKTTASVAHLMYEIDFTVEGGRDRGFQPVKDGLEIICSRIENQAPLCSARNAVKS